MPELVPLYERLVAVAGGGDAIARFLGLYRPTPYLTACSQAVWTRGTPRLIRNYDYHPELWDAALLQTRWLGTEVIAMSDCLWGVLDGMNGAGLAVSLSFGGRKVVGDGFGIPLVLRYILETCDTVAAAVAALERIPVHMAYNVTLLDALGRYATVLVAPDRPAVSTFRLVATNHQHWVEWSQHARATGTLEREQKLTAHLEDPAETADRFVARFLEPPLFATEFHRGWGTLYTAEYRPASGEAIYRWPHLSLPERLGTFQEATITIDYAGPGPRPARMPELP
jgi:predicted choloylglycine hydrolase